eukprot:11356946-Alexandrium_andersonii.AAC.1
MAAASRLASRSEAQMRQASSMSRKLRSSQSPWLMSVSCQKALRAASAASRACSSAGRQAWR